MAIKTNKSYKKRLKITKSGKLLARKQGLNHHNKHKHRSGDKSAERRGGEVHMTNKERSRFLVNL